MFVIASLYFEPALMAQTDGSQALQRDSKMEWWANAKFGMFIHWGLYCVPAGRWGDNYDYGEWIMRDAKIPRAQYAALAEKFNPRKFDAESWVKLAKECGQKYIILTAKHHEGFAMFKSEVSSYNIYDATPFKRDVVKELAEACRKNDMRLGLYYSQAQDWYHPGGAVMGGQEWDETHKGNMMDYIKSIALPQVQELLDNYGDVISVFWWDSPINMNEEMAEIVSEPLRNHPDIITNDRLGTVFPGDIETPEQYVPAVGFPGRDWEVCMTMNDHWGYNAFDHWWKRSDDLLRKLVDIVSKGGNFLLNVGPDFEGNIPIVAQNTLHDIGRWLNVNGEAIYGTSKNPFPYLSYGTATRKGQTIYLHIFEWPENGRLMVPLLNRIESAFLLEDREHKLKARHRKGIGSEILLPSYPPDKNISVLAVTFQVEPEVLPVPSEGKKVTASSSGAPGQEVRLTDGEYKECWTAAAGIKSASIDIDLGSPVKIQSLSVLEPWEIWDNIVQEYGLSVFEAGSWKQVKEFSSKGYGLVEKFPPVEASLFRVTVRNSTEEPRLQEILLYRAE